MPTGRQDHTGSTVISGTVTITGDVIVTGPVQVYGAVSVTGTVSISGTVTVTGTVSISGTVTVSGTVAISGTVTVTGTVAISGTVTVTGSVTVSGTVSISGSVTVTGTVAISGSVTVTGAVTITSGTVAISGTVNITGPVTVSSGNINVATAGGTNIIIDKLTQSAFTARVAYILANPYITATPIDYHAGAAVYPGKVFPRGCRGWIDTVWYWIKNANASADETCTVVLSTRPKGPKIYTQVISIPASNDQWRFAAIRQYWQYDSLTVWIEGLGSNLSVGYDTTDPCDGFYSWDSGTTWTATYRRYFLGLHMYLSSVGDIPISGTITNIQLPNTVGSISHPANNAINGGTTYELLATIYGAGELCGLNVYTQQNSGSTVTDAAQIIGIVVDGTTYEIKASDVVSVCRSTTTGSAAPFALHYILAASNIYAWAITQKIPFQTSLRIYARNNAAAGQYMTAEVMFIYSLLR